MLFASGLVGRPINLGQCSLITVSLGNECVFCRLLLAPGIWTVVHACTSTWGGALGITSLAGRCLMARSYGGDELRPRGDETKVVSLLLPTVILIGHLGGVVCKQLFWEGSVLHSQALICKELRLLLLPLMRRFEVSKLDSIRMKFRSSLWLLTLWKFAEIHSISHSWRTLNLFSILLSYGFFLLVLGVDLLLSCDYVGSDTV